MLYALLEHLLKKVSKKKRRKMREKNEESNKIEDMMIHMTLLADQAQVDGDKRKRGARGKTRATSIFFSPLTHAHTVFECYRHHRLSDAREAIAIFIHA